jgi:hypothetical protein
VSRLRDLDINRASGPAIPTVVLSSSSGVIRQIAIRGRCRPQLRESRHEPASQQPFAVVSAASARCCFRFCAASAAGFDGWLKRRRSAWAARQLQPRTARLLHFEALEPRLLLSADLAAGSITHDALQPARPRRQRSAPCSRSTARTTKRSPTRCASPSTPPPTRCLDAADTRIGQIDVAAAQWQPGVNPISVKPRLQRHRPAGPVRA